jgi:hypothetical protein
LYALSFCEKVQELHAEKELQEQKTSSLYSDAVFQRKNQKGTIESKRRLRNSRSNPIMLFRERQPESILISADPSNLLQQGSWS